MWTNGKERARRFRQAVSHHRAPRTRQSILNQELHIDEGPDPGNSCPFYIPGSFTSRMLEIITFLPQCPQPQNGKDLYNHDGRPGRLKPVQSSEQQPTVKGWV